MNQERHVYDYFYNEKILFRIGHIQYRKAHPPMQTHIHTDKIEFVYLEKGRQNYQTPEQLYTVNPGEVFFSKPNEPHSTGFFPEEVSSFYYMIIDLELLSQLHIFLTPEEYEKLDHFFANAERVTKASDALSSALKNLFKYFTARDEHFDTHIRNALSEALIAVSNPHQISKRISAWNIERSLQYINEHLEESIRVSDLAQLENMSLSTYHKCFFKTMGISPAEYVLKMKIEKTKELLQQTELSVTEIAHRYCFSSSQYFSTVFKRFCYITPTEYRKKYNTINDSGHHGR